MSMTLWEWQEACAVEKDRWEINSSYRLLPVYPPLLPRIAAHSVVSYNLASGRPRPALLERHSPFGGAGS
jgi:hypothetical protein